MAARRRKLLVALGVFDVVAAVGMVIVGAVVLQICSVYQYDLYVEFRNAGVTTTDDSGFVDRDGNPYPLELRMRTAGAAVTGIGILAWGSAALVLLNAFGLLLMLLRNRGDEEGMAAGRRKLLVVLCVFDVVAAVAMVVAGNAVVRTYSTSQHGLYTEFRDLGVGATDDWSFVDRDGNPYPLEERMQQCRALPWGIGSLAWGAALVVSLNAFAFLLVFLGNHADDEPTGTFTW